MDKSEGSIAISGTWGLSWNLEPRGRGHQLGRLPVTFIFKTLASLIRTTAGSPYIRAETTPLPFLGVFPRFTLHGIPIYVARLLFALAALPRLEEHGTWGTRRNRTKNLGEINSKHLLPKSDKFCAFAATDGCSYRVIFQQMSQRPIADSAGGNFPHSIAQNAIEWVTRLLHGNGYSGLSDDFYMQRYTRHFDPILLPFDS